MTALSLALALLAGSNTIGTGVGNPQFGPTFSSALTAPSYTSTAASGANGFICTTAGCRYVLAVGDYFADDGSGNGVWTVAAGKNYQFVSGNKICFDGATCSNFVDYNASFTGELTLTAGNAGLELNAPVAQNNLTFIYNGGTTGSPYTYSRSSAATGSLAWEWFKDNATTEIMGLSPAGVLTSTDGTAGHQVTLNPGASPSIGFAGAASTGILLSGSTLELEAGAGTVAVVNGDNFYANGSVSAGQGNLVNDLSMAGSAANSPVILKPQNLGGGSDTNVSVAIVPRGSGVVQAQGGFQVGGSLTTSSGTVGTNALSYFAKESCAMATGTTCTFSDSTVSSSTGFIQCAPVGSAGPTFKYATVSAGTVTVTASASNSLTWECLVAN